MTADALPDAPRGSVVLKRGRVRPIAQGHPWIFAGAVAEVRGDLEAGEPAWVLDPKGRTLGWGVYSPDSALRVRMWGRETERGGARLGAAITARLTSAAARRAALRIPGDGDDAWRLAHAEGDRLPGLCVDVLGDTAVARYGSIALWQRRAQVAGAIRAASACERVVQLIDQQVAGPEGLYGIDHLDGDEDAERCEVRFRELGLTYEVDVLRGQKTGHYLDQRPNRALVGRLAKGRRVLDLCTHIGGFALQAAAGGAAAVTAVDTSEPALAAARANAARNKLPRVDFVAEDAVRAARARAGASDLVILDPPKLVRARAHKAQGLEKYRAMNRAAVAALAPGGLLLTFSCSGLVGADDLQRAVASAAAAEGRSAHVHAVLGAGRDHPFLAQAPESAYLKGLLVSVSAE